MASPERLLEELDAAVADVVHCFDTMRSAVEQDTGCQAQVSCSGTSRSPSLSSSPTVTSPLQLLPQSLSPLAVLELHAAGLQRAVDHLQTLLPACKVQQNTTAQPASRPGGLADWAPSRLLQLSRELLALVAQRAGKEARLVCGRLRDAYGCPGAALQQPLRGCEPDHLTQHLRIGYHRAREDEASESHQGCLLAAVREALLHPPPVPLGVVERYQQRWPGQVTRLELSTAHATASETLARVNAALPHLQSLKCAWWPPMEDAQLRPFAALTALSLLCTAADVLEDKAGNGACVPHLPELAPGLRSLHLDLRYRQPGLLPTAMQAYASQLTHLALRFHEGTLHPHGDPDVARGALAPIAATLRSLELLSPATWLGGGLLEMLYSMPQLTSLVWSFPGGVEVPHDLLPRWLRVGQLQRLVIGPPDPNWAPYMDRSSVSLEALRGSFLGSCPSMHLQELAMPLIYMIVSEEEPSPVVTGEVQALLGAVQQSCPHLTSLQVGCVVFYPWGDEDEDGAARLDCHLLLDEQPAHQQWLRPVGGMLHLRRLVLCLDAADMRQLAWLASMPELASLSLTVGVEWPKHENGPGQDAAVAAAQTLQQLTQLQELSLDMFQDTFESAEMIAIPMSALLRAACCLPQLQVLCIAGLELPHHVNDTAPWQVLLDHTPPGLRQLSLSHTPWWAPYTEHQLAKHARVLRLLQAGMPPHVQVSSTYPAGAT